MEKLFVTIGSIGIILFCIMIIGFTLTLTLYSFNPIKFEKVKTIVSFITIIVGVITLIAWLFALSLSLLTI